MELSGYHKHQAQLLRLEIHESSLTTIRDNQNGAVDTTRLACRHATKVQADDHGGQNSKSKTRSIVDLHAMLTQTSFSAISAPVKTPLPLITTKNLTTTAAPK
jgi:hypothetical protein